MIAKLMLLGLTMVATLTVIYQSGQAGWRQPPNATVTPTGAPAAPDRWADRVIAEGRLVTHPGAEVVIATELAGTIIQLPVREQSTVKKGDLIAELRSDELQAARDEAVARIEEADAELRFYDREVQRRRNLLARGAAADFELDSNQRGLDVAQARRRAAVAARGRYDALIAKTRITSPIDGVVIARFANPGETLGVAARLVTVADLKRVRIEAEVDEADLGAIVLGAEAMVTAEGFPGTTWRGRVEEIPDVVVGRRLRPEDISRPSDTRVLLVKITLLEKNPLKLGQRIEVQIAKPRR